MGTFKKLFKYVHIWFFFTLYFHSCSNLLLDMRNLQEQVKNAFCYQKLLRPFTLWINCSNFTFYKFSAFSLEFQNFFSITKWYFVTKIVLTYCEKKLFEWSRNNFEITRTIYSNSERSEQFLVTECIFNLFLEVSLI